MPSAHCDLIVYVVCMQYTPLLSYPVDASLGSQATQTDSDASEAVFAQTLRSSVNQTLDEFKEQNRVFEFLEFKGKVQ